MRRGLVRMCTPFIQDWKGPVVAWVAFSSAAGWCRGGCWLGLTKVGSALRVFLHQDVHMLDVGVFDLVVDEFRSLCRRFPMGYLDWNRSGRACSYL
jgi:hypothetical protein